MSLDDRDWYREAIRERDQRLRQSKAQPNVPQPAPHPSRSKWEPSWAMVAPIALIAGGGTYFVISAILNHV